MNISFRKGSIYTPTRGKQFDLIVSNVPHIPTPKRSDNEYVRLNVDAGPNGRKYIDQIIMGAKHHLNEGGRIQLVQSEVTGIEKTLSAFSHHGLSAQVTAEKIEPFGRTGCERIEYYKKLGIDIRYDKKIPVEKVCIITARRKNVSKSKRSVESHTRTVLKAISWRVVATCTSMTIVYLLTKEPIITLEFGFFEVLAKITFYYLHERAWHKVPWGTQKHPLSTLPVIGMLRRRTWKK